MFNFGFMEIMVLLAIAFLALGPEKFPAAARGFLKLLNELRSLFKEVKTEVDQAAGEAKRQISESHEEIQKLAAEPLEGAALEELSRELALPEKSGASGSESPSAPAESGPPPLPGPLKAADREKPPKAAGRPAGSGPAGSERGKSQ